jgi:Zn-dependent alcohol dehydrogenase
MGGWQPQSVTELFAVGIGGLVVFVILSALMLGMFMVIGWPYRALLRSMAKMMGAASAVPHRDRDAGWNLYAIMSGFSVLSVIALADQTHRMASGLPVNDSANGMFLCMVIAPVCYLVIRAGFQALMSAIHKAPEVTGA